MELRDYIRALRKGWVWVLVLTLIGGVSAGAFAWLKPPTYTAQSTVFVSTESDGNAQSLELGNTFTEDRVASYAGLVGMPAVLDPVISQLGLGMSAYALAKDVSASAPANTTLVTIQAKAGSGALAARIANATASSLTAVVSTLETTDSDGGVSPVKLSRVQPAAVPPSASSPKAIRDVTIGLLAGLALGFGIAVLHMILDTKVWTEADVEGITDAPIVGGIAFDPKASDHPLILMDGPHSARAEAFRTLRTNLQYLSIQQADDDSEERRGRSFLVTSSIGSEGKSTTTANLALAIASAGSNVLVVDADLRRPKLAEYLGLEGAVGLTDVLLGRASLKDVAQPWGEREPGGHLYVLPAGRVPPNPSELLNSSRMERLTEMLETEFDYVLFDTPPLLPVADALVLSRYVLGALIVVSAGRAHRNQLRSAVGSLEQVDAPPMGVIMTMLPAKGPAAYGYGRYGYRYAYDADSRRSSTDSRARRKVSKDEHAPRRAPEIA